MIVFLPPPPARKAFFHPPLAGPARQSMERSRIPGTALAPGSFPYPRDFALVRRRGQGPQNGRNDKFRPHNSEPRAASRFFSAISAWDSRRANKHCLAKASPIIFSGRQKKLSSAGRKMGCRAACSAKRGSSFGRHADGFLKAAARKNPQAAGFRPLPFARRISAGGLEAAPRTGTSPEAASSPGFQSSGAKTFSALVPATIRRRIMAEMVSVDIKTG